MFKWLRNMLYGIPHILPPPLPVDTIAVAKTLAMSIVAENTKALTKCLDAALQQLADARETRKEIIEMMMDKWEAFRLGLHANDRVETVETVETVEPVKEDSLLEYL